MATKMKDRRHGTNLRGEPIVAEVSVARMRVSRAPTKTRKRRASHLVVPKSWGDRFLRNAERELADRRAREAGEIVALPTSGQVRRRGGKRAA